ncbi:MAG TPA: BMP family ABC transporter substrate-binding protein [Gaiellaceae bacterium]
MRRKVLAAIALAVALVVAAVAFLGSASARPDKTRATAFKAALVSDVGRFNDKGFNQAQLVGLNNAKKKLNITIGTAESTSDKDYVPNFTTFAAQKYNIVIGAGFLLADAEKQVADQFKSTKFAITDYDVTGDPFKGADSPNVMGSQFSVEQNSYLVGCLAALMAKKAGGNTISGVGGLPIPPVKDFFAGYTPGARKCVKGIKVRIDYSGSFTEQDKCKALAANQISAGSKVVFNVAGPCGFGTLNAAKEGHVWGIGVDVDQAYLGPHILTSAVKRVDLWVLRVIQASQKGTFKGGTNMRFNLKNGGVGLGKISKKVPKAYIAKLNKLKAQIISGKIKVPKSPR